VKTNEDHQGYIEWIEKFDFGTYRLKTEERRRTNEERRRTVENLHQITHGNVTEAPRLGFSSRNQFFLLISSDLELPGGLNIFFPSLLPLFIGKWGRSLPPSSPRRARLLLLKVTAFWRNFLEGPSGLVAICTPIFTKYTPLLFLWFFFRNVTKLVTMLVFFP